MLKPAEAANESKMGGGGEETERKGKKKKKFAKDVQ